MNREEQLDFLINYLIDERNEAIEIPQDYDAKRNLFRSLVNVRMPLKISDEFLKVISKLQKAYDDSEEN